MSLQISPYSGYMVICMVTLVPENLWALLNRSEYAAIQHAVGTLWCSINKWGRENHLGDSRYILKKEFFSSHFFILASSVVKCRDFYLTSHININVLHKYTWSTGLSKQYITSALTLWTINSMEYQCMKHNIPQRLLILTLNLIVCLFQLS